MKEKENQVRCGHKEVSVSCKRRAGAEKIPGKRWAGAQKTSGKRWALAGRIID